MNKTYLYLYLTIAMDRIREAIKFNVISHRI